jgi:dolichol-phosphate mannosyltransferase
VVPCFNEADNIPELLRLVVKEMYEYDYETILVDDGSSDSTKSVIKKQLKIYPRLRYISFSRNFGHQSALRAGLRYARGAAVITMDADLQHPPHMLSQLIKKWESGYKIVYTRRDDSASNSTSLFKEKSSVWFYKIMNRLSGLNIDPGAADFRLLDRKVVDVINKFPEPDLFLRGVVNWVGFDSYAIDYVPSTRFAGVSKYSLKRMVKFALNGLTQFSVKPLRFTVLVGCLMALGAVVYALYAILDYFLSKNSVSGWTSLIIVVLFTSSIQLILLGVVGEYVGKTFMQTKSRPDYIVADTNIENENIH